MAGQTKIDISIILPSFKVANPLKINLPVLTEYLKGLPISWEIIVVDDGSQDSGETQRVAEINGARFIQLARNMGKGAAVRAGMNAAQGDVRLFTDADLPFELVNIEKFYWYIVEKEFHLVIGDRTLAGSDYFGNIPWFRRISSSLFSFFVGRFVITGLFDSQCGLKAFRADVAQDIFGVAQIDRFATDVELLYIALKRNYDIKRLPVRLRRWEASGIRVAREAPRMLIDLLRIRLNFALGRYKQRNQVKTAIDTYLK